jgi:phasin family protein
MQAGAKEVGELAMGFAERNITSSFEFAQRLLQAKDPKEIMALHADYVNSQIAALTEQGKELGEPDGQDDWAGLQALNRSTISTAAEPAAMQQGMSFCASQYFCCNASKMNV